MGFLKRLLGQSMPLTKMGGHISFRDDEYQIEKGPTKVVPTFEEGENYADTTKNEG